MDRDRAICERNELLEKYCHEVKDKAEAQKELSQACKDIETVREERDVARKERTEAIIQRDQLLREYYQARQVLTVWDLIYAHINDNIKYIFHILMLHPVFYEHSSVVDAGNFPGLVK